MTALITLGFNQETCIAVLFLVLTIVLTALTGYSVLDSKLSAGFEVLMMFASRQMGPGVEYPKRKPAKAYWLFGILAFASAAAFIVVVLR